jgi:carnitine O-acetyltransferase
MLDGTPTLRMNEFVLAALDAGKIDLDLGPGEKPGKVEIQELEFVVDDKIRGLVEGARKNFADSLSRHDLKVS